MPGPGTEGSDMKWPGTKRFLQLSRDIPKVYAVDRGWIMFMFVDEEYIVGSGVNNFSFVKSYFLPNPKLVPLLSRVEGFS